MRLSEADHDRVTSAVAAAEAQTDGEIVTIVARQSDPYHDVALHWAVLAMLLVLALLASIPGAAEWLHGLVADPWGEAPSSRMLFTLALVAVTAVAFWRQDRAAGLLLAPYLAWVGLATALTWSVCQANPAAL